jgi:general secretion pathway protein I
VPRREIGPRRDPGFTLLEVLVALLIFGLVFGVLVQIFQTGLRESEGAEEMTAATMLARSQLARIGVDLPLEVGETEEDAGDGFRIRTKVEPVPLGASDDQLRSGALDRPAEQAEEDTGNDQFMPLLVEVTVAWGPDEREREVALTTVRLVPVPSEGAAR